MHSVKLSSKLLATVLAALAAVSNAAPDIIPVAPIGDIAPAPLTSGLAEYYYQVSNGAIVESEVTGLFTSGSSTTRANNQIVPPGQALFGTPITVSTTSAVGATEYTDLHLFFYGANNLLSEYHWTPPVGWQGGSNCTTCIDRSGFFGVNGSQALYAFEYPAGTVRVGFISVGSPGTLTEATKTANGAWTLAPIPNA